MKKSVIILAGGFSKRFGKDKGLLLLADKPLLQHVLDAVGNVVDEKIVVVGSENQAESYVKLVGSEVKIFIDEGDVQSPLAGALKGFKETINEYALLLPCDTPFVSKNVISLLFDLCPNKSAVIPRWPNGYIEPLQAVYSTKPAFEAAKKALSEGKLNMQSMVDKLRGVRYVSTLVLRQLDPELKSFFNVNAPMDLKRAEIMLKEKKN